MLLDYHDQDIAALHIWVMRNDSEPCFYWISICRKSFVCWYWEFPIPVDCDITTNCQFGRKALAFNVLRLNNSKPLLVILGDYDRQSVMKLLSIYLMIIPRRFDLSTKHGNYNFWSSLDLNGRRKHHHALSISIPRR